MRLRIPPTERSQKHPEIRAFAPGQRPLQPNGGYASTIGKGERGLLKKPSPSANAFNGVSSALENAIKQAKAQKKQQSSTQKK
jgi:hypothetical protein